MAVILINFTEIPKEKPEDPVKVSFHIEGKREETDSDFLVNYAIVFKQAIEQLIGYVAERRTPDIVKELQKLRASGKSIEQTAQEYSRALKRRRKIGKASNTAKV